MQDILKQIQSLKEDFMNLIEVEGLGQPASDVPPSTNKIKKDRKTKNGKVELVSVEDELFPYDGNKREQYRQKIIDTINGMIQGTATLEDLLQIVREKKMPVRESLDDQIEKKFKKGEITLNKALELSKKIESKMSQAKNNEERADKIQKEANKKPTIERAVQQRQIGKSIRRNQKKNALTFESMEQALCIAEDLEAMITKKYGSMFGKDTPARGKALHSKAIDSQSREVIDAARRNLPDKEKNSIMALDKEANRIEAKRANTKNKIGEFKTKLLKRAYGKTKDEYEKSLEEALELMEDLADQILKQPAENRAALFYKYHQMKNKEHAGKDSSTRVREMQKQESKEEKGQRKTEQRKKYRGKSVEDWKMGRLLDQVAKNAANLGKNDDPATAKALRRHASKLEEALELMEGLFVNDGRGDLIDDTIMNKPGWTRKKLQDVVTSPIKKFARGCQRKVNENFDKVEENEYNKCKALSLWEQVINEIEDGAINRAVGSARALISFARKVQGMSGSKEFKDKVEDAIAKKNHQIEVVNSKKEDNVIDRAKEDEAKKKKRK